MEDGQSPEILCWWCTSSCAPFGSSLVVGHTVQFFACKACGSVRTEEPFWLDEAYSRPSPDLGLVNRNEGTASLLPLVLRQWKRNGSFCDFGGGTGMLTRMMRDRGYNYFCFDSMATNQFARGFDAPIHSKRWAAISAIEVLEHIPRTNEVVATLFDNTDCLLFQTQILPSSPAPDLENWWYYLLSEGQHVSFPSRDGIKALARSLNLHYYYAGKSFHILSRSANRRMAISAFVGLLSRKVLQRNPGSLLSNDASSVANLST
jgi:Methyltransferase domain